jgi:hypothetical protein
VSNLVPGRYRSVSVTTVTVALTEASLRAHFVGREAYRRTEFLVVRRGAETALLRVAGPAAADDPLFRPIEAVELLAGPAECACVVRPEVDTGVPSQLARVAAELPGARCVVVQGRYEHVNFVLDPVPVEIAVVEVSPPRPPKLVDQLERVLAVAEDLPPVVLRPRVLDLVEDVAGGRTAAHWLFPCRGSGAAPDGRVSYLDERPPRSDWVLVGCARSRELHRWFYGDLPSVVEMCPRVLAGEVTVPTITKCCLQEEGIVRDGQLVTVPWGASLEEIRGGLEAAVAIAEPAWTPA